jgi:hypothetical protein
MTVAATAPVATAAAAPPRPAISPFTGWSRDHWVDLLGRLTAGFAAAIGTRSPARPWLPGSDGDVVTGLEGFARMSVAWGAWLGLASNGTTVPGPDGPIDIERLMVRGLLDGTDPSRPWSWGRMTDRDQRIVEAAELSTGLWLGRARLGRSLGPAGIGQVLDWLDQVHGLETYDDNWVLFPALVATVARGFGRTVPDALIDAGIDTMLDRYRGDGWYSDGPGEAFDAYCGWAVHWDLLLWSQIDGERRPRIRRLVAQRARTYLRSIVPQFAADGSRPLFGRSLGYRFAAAAPFALAELLGLDAVDPGLARRIASGTIARHLELGAIDPATDWLRRGVGAERPEVCERYVSAGAAAWAAHVFVALGLPPDAPFWTRMEQPLPVEHGEAGGEGRVAIRGPGFLFGWRGTTGETWLVNSRSGHPDDIPGHDYRPFYGKFAYRSHFPASIRTAAGQLPIDGTVLFESSRGVDQRSVTERGGAGPDWTWSVYAVGGPAGAHRATTIVLPWRTIEVRATGVRPGGGVRLREGSAALPVAAGEAVDHRSSSLLGWQAAATASHAVAIRRLHGYDLEVASGSDGASDGASDVNLIDERVEQPTVQESRRSDQARMVAAASAALAAGAAEGPGLAELIGDLEAVAVAIVDRWILEVRLGREETCRVVLGRGGARDMEVRGRRFSGPSIRVVRARNDDSGFGGEQLLEIAGVIRLDAPGPIAIRRQGAGVRITTSTGFAVDPRWSGAFLTHLHPGPEEADERPERIERLEQPGVVPSALIRRLQRRSGRTLVDVELQP